MDSRKLLIRRRYTRPIIIMAVMLRADISIELTLKRWYVVDVKKPFLIQVVYHLTTTNFILI